MPNRTNKIANCPIILLLGKLTRLENTKNTKFILYSPAPSHSSVTTNEDQGTTNCNQSDVSNSSLGNVGSPSTQTSKKDRVSKKLLKELAPCKVILEDLECHDDAWPFLLPVNTKQFPTYKKIIKTPMDLSTIKKKLYDVRFVVFVTFCVACWLWWYF